MVIVVLDSDKAGDEFLNTIRKELGEEAGRLFFVEMPEGIKDVNEYHCTHCHKDVEAFKNEFNRLTLVPATEQGFDILAQVQGTGSIVTEDYIKGYIKHVARGDQLLVDKMVQRLYMDGGRAVGIQKSTIRNLAKSIAAQEVEVKEEDPLEDLGLLLENETSYSYKRPTLTGYTFEKFTNFKAQVVAFMDTGESITSKWRITTEEGSEREIILGSNERASEQDFILLLSEMPRIQLHTTST